MSAPVPDVKAATQRAQQELDWLRCHKEASLEAWQEHVRAYVRSASCWTGRRKKRELSPWPRKAWKS